MYYINILFMMHIFMLFYKDMQEVNKQLLYKHAKLLIYYKVKNKTIYQNYPRIFIVLFIHNWFNNGHTLFFLYSNKMASRLNFRL